MSATCSFCHALMWLDEKTNNSNSRPEFQLCCGKGQYVIQPYPATPSLISDLLKGSNEASKEFKLNIRSYNSSLSFTSLGVNLDRSVQNRVGGAYTFRIHGSLYHRIGMSLEPRDGQAPNFAQIYVYDSANELRNRHAVAQHVSITTLENLQNLMHEINPYARDFKTMAQLDRETPGGLSDVSMVFRAENTPDPRRYNAPTTSTEIGVLIVGADGSRDPDQSTFRDILIRLNNTSNSQQQSNQFQTINEINQHYDPMQYVLMFPSGNPGWNIASATIDGSSKVTILQFYRYHLMYRPSSSPDIGICDLHLFGALFHQYVVDMYAKMEQERLNFIRRNQNTLRCELYNNLQDAVLADDFDASITGKKWILPSSFIGSPRHMSQLYQDAMSIVRRYGKPDLFITFTCNPSWEEITNELLFGQAAGDRPDLCSRVFHMKLKSLLNDIRKNEIFGRVVADVYTIEFQKRGLPHAHILLILDSDSKIRDIDIDLVISAELPDPANDELLYHTVSTNMMHGPCGEMYPNAPCMKSGQCSKQFPKKFNNTTTVPQSSAGGYPNYMRRNNGRVVNRRNVTLDNRWVVPHNPYLTIKYNAHINVELCASFSSVKYVYKYVFKGHDRAQVSIDSQNEIQNFLDARYVSAAEACWRLFSFSLHDENPKHQRLMIHLPDQEIVYFNENDNAEDLNNRTVKLTTLTAFFLMNSENEFARTLLYTEFPEHFTWKKNKWHPRQRGFGATIGRIYSISPKEVEKYCLRMLLNHVRGPTSFIDLKTVDGVVHSTFREAARAMSLLQDDSEWSTCLTEASSYQLPSSLRNLFVIIIVFNSPSDPYGLWCSFRDQLTEDYFFERRQQLRAPDMEPDQHVYDCGLFDIEQQLQSHEYSLTNYSGFVVPSLDPRNLFHGLLSEEQLNEPRLIREQLLLSAYASLEQPVEHNFNLDQQAVFNNVLELVNSSDATTPKAVFIDGPGGTGKTYLFNALLDSVRRNGGIALAVAASGTAALLLKGGKTAHSSFKIPLSVNQESICSITPLSATARLIRLTKLIIWDEASMISRDIIEAIDRTFKEICKVDNNALLNVPFGGKVIVFGGDFRQVLPVIPKANRSQIVSQCISRSFLWRSVKKMRLFTNMRVQNAIQSNNSTLAREFQDFADYLLEIGNGNAPVVDNNNAIELRSSMVLQGTNVFNLISTVFNNFQGTAFNEDRKNFIINRAILTSLNSDVATINNILLDQFDGQLHSLLSADSLCTEGTSDALRYPTELLNNIESGSLPPHCLKLKVGCPIMLLRNLDPSKGLCNGTRLFCLSITQTVILAEIATGSKVGDIVTIPRIKLESQEQQIGIHFSRLQFPVRTAFAMTINKSQGQTLDFVGLYLPRPVFSHGQLYVAMSRVKTPSSIKVLIGHNSQNNSTDNVVYKEVLE